MRRLVVATLTLGLLVPVVPAHAASAKPTAILTIKAKRHARLTVRLPAPLTLWLEDDGDVDGPIFSGGGKHAGFLLVPTSPRNETFGVVRTPGAPKTSITLWAGDDARPTVPAGSYTLEVVADEPVDIRVGIRGMATRTWTATAPLSVRTADGVFSGDVGRELTGDGKLALSATSAVFTVATFQATGLTVSVQWCVSRAVACGGAADSEGSSHTSTQPLVEQTMGAAFYLAPRDLPAGSWSTRWTVGSDVLVREPTAYALVVG